MYVAACRGRSALREFRDADHVTSYFVTELLGTDLHRLLTSRPLEKQFIQYFLYQIMVCQDAHRRIDGSTDTGRPSAV